jgi:hypothetical protein
MAEPSSMEKHGAARWARCPGCAAWVHVSQAILDAPEIDLHCPACERRFPSEESPEVI